MTWPEAFVIAVAITVGGIICGALAVAPFWFAWKIWKGQ